MVLSYSIFLDTFSNWWNNVYVSFSSTKTWMNSNTGSTQGIFLRCSSNVWIRSYIRKCKGYIRLAFGKNHQIDTRLSLIFPNWPAVPHQSNCLSPPINTSQCAGAPSDWLGPFSLPCPGLLAFSCSLSAQAFPISCAFLSFPPPLKIANPSFQSPCISFF